MRRIKKRHAFIHRSSYRVFALLRPRDIVGAPSGSPPAKPGTGAGAGGAVAADGRNSRLQPPLPAGSRAAAACRPWRRRRSPQTRARRKRPPGPPSSKLMDLGAVSDAAMGWSIRRFEWISCGLRPAGRRVDSNQRLRNSPYQAAPCADVVVPASLRHHAATSKHSALGANSRIVVTGVTMEDETTWLPMRFFGGSWRLQSP